MYICVVNIINITRQNGGIENMRKFMCFTANSKYELNANQILNMEPNIDKLGNASIQVNYYDFEYGLSQTIYCRAIEVVYVEEE